jgi:hypothetical protein
MPVSCSLNNRQSHNWQQSTRTRSLTKPRRLPWPHPDGLGAGAEMSGCSHGVAGEPREKTSPIVRSNRVDKVDKGETYIVD